MLPTILLNIIKEEKAYVGEFLNFITRIRQRM